MAIWFDEKRVKRILEKGDSRLKAKDIVIARKSDIDEIKQRRVKAERAAQCRRRD